MPRVHFVLKARKDNPVCKAGESYYWWKFRHGGKHRSLTSPKASQLTQSDKLSRSLAAGEAIGEYTITDVDDLQAASDFLTERAGEIEEVFNEYRESVENMPENLQESPVAEECTEKADELENWQQEIEGAAGDIEAVDVPDLDDTPEPPRSDYDEGDDGDDEYDIAWDEWRNNNEENEQARADALEEAQGYLDAVCDCPIM